jgi:hypothetical protein
VANLTVTDVFPPDDPVAQFCVSMAMAANDVEDAIREAVDSNPEGATDEVRERLRFSHKVRVTYGYLFEGIDALKGWRQAEPEVAKLLQALCPKGAKLLKKVCGLEQKIGPKKIAHVRQNTFHYPHPEPSKAAGWVAELAEVLKGLEDLPATVNMSQDVQHTFPFADTVAMRLSLREHTDDVDSLEVRDGAIAFVNLIRHVHIRYCEGRSIAFTVVGDGPDEFELLTHQPG